MIWALFAGMGKGARLISKRRELVGPDGTRWLVEGRAPGASNAMITFLHPDPERNTLHRYAWHLTDGPASRDVRARLAPQEVLDSLSDADLLRYFRRSMPISSRVPRLEPAMSGTHGDQTDVARAAEDVRPI